MVRPNVHIVVKFCSKKTPDERQRLGHEFCTIHFGLSLHDRADFAKGGAHLGASGHVLICRVCDEDISELMSLGLLSGAFELT